MIKILILHIFIFSGILNSFAYEKGFIECNNTQHDARNLIYKVIFNVNNDSKKQTSIDDISGATVFYYIPSKEKAAEIKLMMTGKKIDPYKTSNDRNARLIKMSFIDSASGISLDFTYGSTIVYSGFFDRTGKPANSLQALVESQLPKKLQLIQNKKEMLWYSTNNLGCRFLP